MENNLHRRGLIITIGAVLLLSPDSLLVKLLSCDVWTMLFWRSLITGTFLLAGLALIYRRRLITLSLESGRYGLMSAMVAAAGSLMFVNALMRTTAANTLVILAATPLFAALIGYIFIRERISRTTLGAIFTVFCGIVLIFMRSLEPGDMVGNFLALGAASLWGGNLVVLRQARALNMIPPIAFGSLLAIPFALAGGWPEAVSSRDAWLLLLQGSLVLPLSFALITRGSRYLPAAEVSLILLLETLLGPLWVWLVVGESPDLPTLLAGLLILTTLVVHSLLQLKNAPSAPLAIPVVTAER